MPARTTREEILGSARDALAAGPDWRSVLDELPAPIYVTDTDGAVTYWNQACVELAGRQPQIGQDRWCVTWKLYTFLFTDIEGSTRLHEALPHDECPMAVAIKQQQIVRDAIAIAARPDGSRIAFKPYPTPLFDADGALTGAVNMLIDVTDEQTDSLNEQAERCRRLADSLYSRESATVLETMAREYEQAAAELRKQPPH